MSAAKFDFDLEIGAVKNFNIVLKDSYGTPWDLTSYSGRMQIKTKCPEKELMLDLTSANGMINIPSPYTGNININIPVSGSSRFPNSQQCEYDLFIYSGVSNAYRVIYGDIDVISTITS